MHLHHFVKEILKFQKLLPITKRDKIYYTKHRNYHY